MGKSLIQQRKGKGSSRFRAPSFKYAGEAKHRPYSGLEKTDSFRGTIVDILHSPGHSAPLTKVVYEDKAQVLTIAPQGVKVGDEVMAGVNAALSAGNTMPLLKITEGTLIHNIESIPGDGGKFVRSSGSFARVLENTEQGVTVLMPSKKEKTFNPWCRATIGVVAGAGRIEKPLLMAGAKYHKAKQRNRYWPRTGGIAMNAVAHPFGGSRSSKKNRPLIARRFAPPGAKVGHIRPRKTGRG